LAQHCSHAGTEVLRHIDLSARSLVIIPTKAPFLRVSVHKNRSPMARFDDDCCWSRWSCTDLSQANLVGDGGVVLRSLREFLHEKRKYRELRLDRHELSSTLHISGGVTERFSESLQQGDWNFYWFIERSQPYRLWYKVVNLVGLAPSRCVAALTISAPRHTARPSCVPATNPRRSLGSGS
jgi:hypothetical protein